MFTPVAIILIASAHLLIGLGIGLWLQRRQWTKFTSAQQALHVQQLEGCLREARTDPLTELTNRRGFDELLRRRVGEREQRKTPVALLILDIDHFKTFNDEHGHLAGDEVLRSVARVLSQQLRDRDVIARIGGDEFAVILFAADLDDAVCAAERVRAAVARNQVRVHDTLVRVTLSIGVAETVRGETSESLFKRADAAVYASKQAGRNRVSRHDGHCVLASSGLALD